MIDPRTSERTPMNNKMKQALQYLEENESGMIEMWRNIVSIESRSSEIAGVVAAIYAIRALYHIGKQCKKLTAAILSLPEEF